MMTRTANLSRRGFLAASGATVTAVGLGGLLSACGSDKASAGGGRKITAVLDVTPYGKHVPFYVGLSRGFWRDRDLDVSFQAGKGSGDAVSKVASGAGQFALADTSVVALARGNQNQPVMVTCMYHYKNLMSELTLEGNGITKPADLVGSTQHVTAGEGTFALLPALAQANGFDSKRVKTTVGEFTQIVPALLSGQVDGALTYYTLFPALQAAAEAQGMKASAFLYADHGIDVYNNGIVTTETFAEKNPEVVKAFNDGFVEAVQWTAKHPDEATEIFIKAVAGTNQKTARAQLQVALDHLNVAEVQKNGFGPMSLDKMKTTLEMVNEYFDLSKPVTDPTNIFTNEFVTPGKVPVL
jgi:NitT/TauT family transport system substrate-binding protein